MNWTDFAVFAIILGCMYFGWKRGFIVAAIEFVKWIASIVVARLFYVRFTDTLISIFGDPSDKISKHVTKYLYDMLGFDVSATQALPPTQMEGAIGTLKLPMLFEQKIREGISEKLISTTSGFVEEASIHMTQMILYGLGFLLLVVLLISLLSFAQVVGNVLSKLPIIKELNNGGGLILGSVIGIICVYFFMASLTYLRTFGWAQETLIAIENSKFAVYFYKYNILQYVVNNILIKGQLG